MLELRENIVISNVARNHSYPIVEAAASAGYLKKFITSVYWKPDTFLGNVAHSLVSGLGEHARNRLEGRHSHLVPDERVETIPIPELVDEAMRMAAARLSLDSRSAFYLRCEFFD